MAEVPSGYAEFTEASCIEWAKSQPAVVAVLGEGGDYSAKEVRVLRWTCVARVHVGGCV